MWVGEDLNELDKSVAHRTDHGSFLFDPRAARASAPADGLNRNDAVSRVDQPLVARAEVIPGIKTSWIARRTPSPPS